MKKGLSLKNTIKNLVVLIIVSGGMMASFAAYGWIDKDSSETKKNATNLVKKDSLRNELKNYIPNLYPTLMKDRLTCIENKVKLSYNEEVLGWIKFYVQKNRAYTQKVLERTPFYFPIFEEALKRHNMPEELKYLSIVESALQPKAASWAAAVGLWQFIPETGKEYGLYQDWFIDERMDLYKSTDAACRYLKFLHNYHGDWQLALAAYNCGSGRVNWAVKQSGGKDFWSVYKYLPAETRSYVPAFIGTVYAMNYAEEHFIFTENEMKPIPSDTILVSQFLNLNDFAKQIDVPIATLEILNPHLKKNAIPEYKKKYPVRFPAEKRAYLDANRIAVLRASSRASSRDLPYIAGNTENTNSSTVGKKQVSHTVLPGQSLAFIALKYNVTVPNIRIWNKLTTGMIYPNQNLAIWIPATQATQTTQVVAQNTTQKTTTTQKVEGSAKTQTSTNYQYHTIQSGDTLWDIANKYQGSSVDKIKLLNKMTDKTMLVPGQKIIVGTK
jgi:membrane-bound lytic murein transglycosylase D